jgi:hypothetical protein
MAQGCPVRTIRSIRPYATYPLKSLGSTSRGWASGTQMPASTAMATRLCQPRRTVQTTPCLHVCFSHGLQLTNVKL